MRGEDFGSGGVCTIGRLLSDNNSVNKNSTQQGDYGTHTNHFVIYILVAFSLDCFSRKQLPIEFLVFIIQYQKLINVSHGIKKFLN